MAKKEKNELQESTKDAGRIAIFGAISTVLTYVINTFLPELPTEVSGAILVLILAALTWVDSYIHNSKDIKANGLVPF